MRKKGTAILFDGPNFHHSLVRMGFRLDFEALERYCHENYGDVLIRRYYASGGNILPPEFVAFLISKGYEVVVTPQVDTQITVDAVDMISRGEVSTIVLVSSDGSYFPLVKYAHESGVRMVIAHDQDFQGFAMLLKGAIRLGLADYINIREFQKEVPAPGLPHVEGLGEELPSV